MESENADCKSTEGNRPDADYPPTDERMVHTCGIVAIYRRELTRSKNQEPRDAAMWPPRSDRGAELALTTSGARRCF
jgi:hypothetical protein